MSSDALRYRSAGVDTAASDEAKARIEKLVTSTFTEGALGAFGGFGGMFRVPAGMAKPPTGISRASLKLVNRPSGENPIMA